MINTLVFFAFLFLAAFLLAKLEIQIEGKHGWAEKLPVSWRTTNKWAKWFGVTTSYHLYLNLFLLSMVHLPFAFGVSWGLGTELMVLSFLLLLQLVEDFLWFVLNPHYGIKKFNKEHIAWWPEWWWKLPAWYYRQLVIGLALYIIGRIVR